VWLLWTSDQPDTETSLPDKTQHPQKGDTHTPDGIRIRNPSKQAAAEARLRPRGHWNQHLNKYETLSAQGVRNVRSLSSKIPYLEADGN